MKIGPAKVILELFKVGKVSTKRHANIKVPGSYKGLLVYFSPFFSAILVDRAYGPKKSVNFSLDFAVF